MKSNQNAAWFRYQFVNSSGREFDTTGIGEKHDPVKGIIEIDKGDGTTSVECGVYAFTKTFLLGVTGQI